jgi:predicted AlkP superfamily phosphohydrolase/phosphomutase
MPAKIMFIGLDAADADLIDRWAADGELPNLAAMGQDHVTSRMETSVDLFPGGVWFELASGRLARHSGRFFESRVLRTGEARMRPATAIEAGIDDTFWRHASHAGRRVAVADIPHTRLDRSLNGIQIVQWGTHDRDYMTGSHPEDLLAELRRRCGDHPVQECDLYPSDWRGYRRLRDDLKAGIAKKTGLILDLLRRDEWDLFAFGLGELHCAGHHLWHLFDPGHPDYVDEAPADLKAALFQVYRAVDDAVGRIIDAAGPATTTIVATSHGMNLNPGGVHLLPEILARLGMGSNGHSRSGTLIRRLNSRLKYFVPRRYLGPVRAVAHALPIRRVQERGGCLVDPFESPRTRAAALPNNHVGAVRLNLKGREPFGSVAPGNEAIDVIEEIREELQALRDPASDEPIVARVYTPEEAFGADYHPDVPDLFVQFRSDLGVIESCRSARVGTIRERINAPRNPRTGNHTPASRIWLGGSDISADLRLDRPRSVDIAPTILGLLDVPSPPGIDGRNLIGG